MLHAADCLVGLPSTPSTSMDLAVCMCAYVCACPSGVLCTVLMYAVYIHLHKAMKTAYNIGTTTSTCSTSELYMEFEMSCSVVTVTVVIDAHSDG